MVSLQREDEGMGSVAAWLTQHTHISAESSVVCAGLLESDGATSIRLLTGAGYTREDLVKLGIQKPHAAAIVCSLKTSGKPKEHVRHRSVSTPRGRGSKDVVGALERVCAGDVLDKKHALVVASELGCTSPLGVPRVLTALLQVATLTADPTTTFAILEALVRLMEDPNGKCKGEMGAAGACRVVMPVLQRYTEDAEITRTGVKAIGLLALNNENLVKMDGVGASEYLVAALKGFSDVEAVQEAGLEAVARLGRCAETERRMHDAGVCEAIMAAINRFQGARQVQYSGMRAMLAMSLANDPGKRELGALGACEAVVRGMQKFSDKGFLTLGCTVIKHLALGNPENGRRLGRGGACGAVVGVLKSLRSDADVASEAIEALWRMCMKSEDNKKACMQEGGREAVEEIRQMHHTSNELDHSAKRLLEELSKGTMYF